MRTTVPALAALLVLLGATPTSAQQRWIVDSNNGPGTHFTTLIAAIASPNVSHGDVLELRAGGYVGTTINKGVSIVATGGVSIGSGGTGVEVVITSLPAGTRCTLRGIEIRALPYKSALAITNCAGAVHLDMVTVPVQGILCLAPGVTCSNCASVTVNDCTFHGLPPLSVADTNLAVAGSILAGANARWSDTIYNASAPGIGAVRSQVTVAFTTVTGGNGYEFDGRPIWGYFYWRGMPAIACEGGSLSVTGPTGTTLTAGTSPRFEPVPAIQLNGVPLVAVDPRVRLLPSHSSPPITGLPPYSPYRPVAGLRAQQGANALAATVLGQPGNATILALGLPAVPFATSLGSIWLDLRATWIVGSGVLAGDTLPLAVPVPNDPALFGLAVGLQALLWSPQAVEVTNPAVVVLR